MSDSLQGSVVVYSLKPTNADHRFITCAHQHVLLVHLTGHICLLHTPLFITVTIQPVSLIIKPFICSQCTTIILVLHTISHTPSELKPLQKIS